jgi:UDP-glucuronate decarboxylase
MKTVLVTGGAGFIGSHLCEVLLERGNKVVCLDNLYTGSIKNIEHLKHHAGFKLVEASVQQRNAFDAPVDQIYNLACPASPPHYQKDPVETVKTNVFGIFNILDLAKKYNAALLQASTSEVYGDPEVHPQSETYFGNVNCNGPRSCYDEGKRIAETIALDFSRTRGVNVKIVRIFNTYGPKMMRADGRVVSNFIVQALKGEDITIYGSGSQTRSFCYVDDLIRAIIKMADTENFSGPVNLGNDAEITIAELAKIVIELTNSRSKIIFKPLPADDPRRRRPDLSLALKMLNWKPSVPLKEGLLKTIKYFEKELK